MKNNYQKKGFRLLLLSLSIFLSTNMYAQKLSKKFSFGFGFEAGQVKGDNIAKEGFDYNGGITLRASVKAGPGFITVTSGALAFRPINEYSEEYDFGFQIPVKLGYKLIILKRLFVQGEAGYSRLGLAYKDDDDKFQSVNTGGFTITPSAGFNFGPLELGVRYETIKNLQFDGGDKFILSSLGVRLGFNF
jgi:hypothetical protein